MAERPLRLKIFILLQILDSLITFQVIVQDIVRRQLLPPFSTWYWLTLLVYYYVSFMLLAALWIKNRIGYMLALIYISYEVALYFIAYPTYPTIFVILEIPQLILLLSLFTYFLGKP